jgi:hypothetical protein
VTVGFRSLQTVSPAVRDGPRRSKAIYMPDVHGLAENREWELVEGSAGRMNFSHVTWGSHA